MAVPPRTLGAIAAAVLLTAFVSPAAAQSSREGPAELHAALHLHRDQEAAWNAWRAAIAPTSQEVAQLRSAAQRYGTLRTPQRVDLDQQTLAIRAAIMRRGGEATKRFYAQLAPDQQHTFDELTAPPPPQR